jgi:DNA invertase Pin-like site-specific DNA recombinase
MMSKVCALYVRVSTEGQEVDNQLLQLQRYAEKQDYEVAAEYVDVVSGKENSRPSYDQLFRHAHQRLFDVVVFWDLSRFSRGGTLFTLQKLKELENAGVAWESYQEPYIRSLGQFKDVVISIFASVAKIEREKISERTKAGLARKRAQGVVLGRPPGSKDQKPRKKKGYYK